MNKTWRPAFAWAFIGFYVTLGLVVMVLMLLRIATLSEASGLLITMIAAGGGVTGVYTKTRSDEKKMGVAGNG